MKLEFLYMPTRDLGAALALYRDGLGWQEAWREGESTVSLALPGTDVQLMLDVAGPDDRAPGAGGDAPVLRRLLDPGDGAAGTAGTPARRGPRDDSSPLTTRARSTPSGATSRPTTARSPRPTGRASGPDPGAVARRSGASWGRSSAGSRTTSTIRSTRCMTPWRGRWTSGRPVSGWSWG